MWDIMAVYRTEKGYVVSKVIVSVDSRDEARQIVDTAQFVAVDSNEKGGDSQ